MTRKMTSQLILGLFLLLPLASAAGAESTPEAQVWLEKLLSIYDRGPFTVEYVAELDLSAMGQPMTGAMKGKMLQADRTHSRMQLEIEFSGMPGMEGPMLMKVTTVSDGTTTWTEMDNPAMGGMQVMKLSLEDAAKMGESGGGGFGMNPTTMDPVAQLEAWSKTMDFDVVGSGGGEVTLRGKITDEMRGKLGAALPPNIDTFLFVIDEETGFPTELRSGGETPFITMKFSNFQFVDADSLDPGSFEYSPPEGVTVMDLGAMLPQKGQ